MKESITQTSYAERQFAAVEMADSTRMYLNSIRQEQLLDGAEAEVELAKTIEAGVYAESLLADPDAKWREKYTQKELEEIIELGAEAKQQMIKANLRLMPGIARTFGGGKTMDFLDIAQEGYPGLVRAVEKFDYTKGYKFSTYATEWIRQAMSRALYSHDDSFAVGYHTAERQSRMRRRADEFVRDNGYEPTDEQLAKLVKTTVKDIEHLRSLPRTAASVDDPVSEDSEIALGMLIGQVPQDAVENEAIGDELYWMAQDLLSVLSDDERNVICMRFGWYGGEELPFTKIAKKLSIGQRKVSDIYSDAMIKMGQHAKDFLKIPTA